MSIILGYEIMMGYLDFLPSLRITGLELKRVKAQIARCLARLYLVELPQGFNGANREENLDGSGGPFVPHLTKGRKWLVCVEVVCVFFDQGLDHKGWLIKTINTDGQIEYYSRRNKKILKKYLYNNFIDFFP